MYFPSLRADDCEKRLSVFGFFVFDAIETLGYANKKLESACRSLAGVYLRAKRWSSVQARSSSIIPIAISSSARRKVRQR